MDTRPPAPLLPSTEDSHQQQLFQWSRYSGHSDHSEQSTPNLHYSRSHNRDFHEEGEKCRNVTTFQMPLHYPRYRRPDYERMEKWKLDLLLSQYGLSFDGSLDEKRQYAMGAILWPDQL